MHRNHTDPVLLAEYLQQYMTIDTDPKKRKVLPGVQCEVEASSYEIFQGEVQSWKIVTPRSGPEIQIVFRSLCKAALEPGVESKLDTIPWHALPDLPKEKAHVIRFPFKFFWETGKKRVKIESENGEVCRFLPKGDTAALVKVDDRWRVGQIIRLDSRYVKHKKHTTWLPHQ
jgi:hypothetical protein